MKKFISLLIVAAMLLLMCSCTSPTAPDEGGVLYPDAAVQTVTLGSGTAQFDFSAFDENGTEYRFLINTDKATVGEALEELGLIEGSEGDYGLYVEKVNGITAKYEESGTYWAFYVDGEYALSGIDMTEITEGTAYALKVEK